MGHNVLHQIHEAGNNSSMLDPGDADTILVDRSPAYVGITSVAAETRTLARPTRRGAIVTVALEVDGGDVTLTVTGGYTESGDTTFVFTGAGQFATFLSVATRSGTTVTYAWRLIAQYGSDQSLATPAGVGITAGTGTVYESSVRREGGIITTRIMIDLTGLGSSTTDLDVIGVAGGPAHLGQITTEQNGVILAGRVTCLELPATGADDIILYSADEGTAVFDDGIAALTNDTVLVDPAGAWTNGAVKGVTTVPAPNQYLYLANGEAGTVGTYTAGKFLIELFGLAP